MRKIKCEKIRFEEEGNMERIKLTMDTKQGGRFFIYKDEKPKPEPIENKLNPPIDNVFGDENGIEEKLPF